jgi:hypothetical protein
MAAERTAGSPGGLAGLSRLERVNAVQIFHWWSTFSGATNSSHVTRRFSSSDFAAVRRRRVEDQGIVLSKNSREVLNRHSRLANWALRLLQQQPGAHLSEVRLCEVFRTGMAFLQRHLPRVVSSLSSRSRVICAMPLRAKIADNMGSKMVRFLRSPARS